MTPIRHPQRQTFSRMFALQTITRDPAAPAASETTEAAALNPLPRLLDGVAFRRAFHRQGSRRLRTEEPLTLALLGIDDFAAIERQHGPAVGDRAVATTSRQLHDVFRASDLLACWGRERFAVLMPGTGLPGGIRAVEKALLAVYGASLSAGADRRVELSVSAGALAVLPAMPFQQAVEQAEGLLSLAQQQGRARLRWPEGEIVVDPRRVVAITLDPRSLRALAATPLRVRLEVLEPDPHVVAAAERAAPGLIVLDIDSSGEAAWEVLHRLRGSLRLQGVPILVVGSQRDHLGRSFAAGADDFVLRSATNEELRARAERLICRRADVLVTRIA